MVADRIEVVSRKAGRSPCLAVGKRRQGQLHRRPGRGGRGCRAARGVIVPPGEDAKEFRRAGAVEAHRAHSIPTTSRSRSGWRRPARTATTRRSTGPPPSGPGRKTEITEEEHAEFYRHVAHAFDIPWATVHYRAEGMLSYTGLLYVPTMRPFDLYEPERKGHVKPLRPPGAGQRAGGDGVLPPWLRFLRGVVDSEDLPLKRSAARCCSRTRWWRRSAMG